MLAALCLTQGCATRRSPQHSSSLDMGIPEQRVSEKALRLLSFSSEEVDSIGELEAPRAIDETIRHANFLQTSKESGSVSSNVTLPGATTTSDAAADIESTGESTYSAPALPLETLEQRVARNPTLCKIWREYQAALAKTRYVGLLPDPQISANIFGQPIETASGSQRANLTVSQMLPWLARLDARTQQAIFEAVAIRQTYAAERLKLITDVRTHWYRLFVLQKQIDINVANQQLLKSLIEVASSRVSTGQASQSDVLSATLEYTQIEEQLVSLRQQITSTKAQLNRVIGRDPQTVIAEPTELVVSLPDWDQEMLQSLTWNHQPELEAARINRQATRWGVEVARLKRRPDFTMNASWFGIDDNRPATGLVDVGKDAWSLGAMMTIPAHREKYHAMEQDALWKHAASSSSVEEVRQRFEAKLVDQWEQARAADETASLYQETILPEAKRAFESDLKAYSNGNVTFDRVLRNFRNLLKLELGFYRSRGQLATALARIWQITGGSVPLTSDLPNE